MSRHRRGWDLGWGSGSEIPGILRFHENCHCNPGCPGIGQAIAGRLAVDGFTVVVEDVDEPSAITAAAVLSGMGIGVDVSDSAAVQRMAAAVLDRYGSIDVLVDNAGVTGKAAPVHEYRDEEWRRVMAIDLDGMARRPCFLPCWLKGLDAS